MYHRLIVHIFQTLSDAFELSEEKVSDECGRQGRKTLQAQTGSHPCVS